MTVEPPSGGLVNQQWVFARGRGASVLAAKPRRTS
jgi:hypothetical protein